MTITPIDATPPNCGRCNATLKKLAEVADENSPIGVKRFLYSCSDCGLMWADNLDGEPLVMIDGKGKKPRPRGG